MTHHLYKKISFFFSLLAFLVFPIIALAQEGVGQKIKNALTTTGCRAGFFKCDAPPPDFIVVLGAYINGILGLFGIVFFVWVLVGGFFWMTAGGNEEKVAKAKRMIVNSAIGIAIILLAATIVNFALIIITPAVTP